jgi:hypothetical protein
VVFRLERLVSLPSLVAEAFPEPDWLVLVLLDVLAELFRLVRWLVELLFAVVDVLLAAWDDDLEGVVPGPAVALELPVFDSLPFVVMSSAASNSGRTENGGSSSSRCCSTYSRWPSRS